MNSISLECVAIQVVQIKDTFILTSHENIVGLRYWLTSKESSRTNSSAKFMAA
jgi:hypothetical protein